MMRIKIKTPKPRNPVVAPSIKRKAGKHKDRRREPEQIDVPSFMKPGNPEYWDHP